MTDEHEYLPNENTPVEYFPIKDPSSENSSNEGPIPPAPPVAQRPGFQPPSPPAPSTATKSGPSAQRLESLDVLRGFDMFWIIGGCSFLLAVANYIGNPAIIETVKWHTKHVGWEGFAAIDLVFPLFVFITGATMPFSIRAKIERGEPKWRLYRRLARRTILLLLLGLLGKLLSLDFANLRPLSVLGLIGMAYLIAGLVVINRGPRGQAAWAVGILMGYWAALMFIPVPGIGAGMFTPGGCLCGYIDYNLLPGKLYQGVFDPEGILTWIPAAAMALIGAQAGNLLRANPASQRGYRNFFTLAASGIVLLAIGWGWGQWFPIIKAIWSTTFVLFAAGWSLLLLSICYLFIDVWRERWLGFVFIPIGMNAITIYVAGGFVDFGYTAERIFGGLEQAASENLAPVIATLGVVVVKWMLLFFLYRKKIFIRV
ncbi:MAG: DUF5009 domain-containing protein [Planctomycetota bacterium]|nr:DUF5009 domain-containing protein [Planctomycetota bacterium]